MANPVLQALAKVVYLSAPKQFETSKEMLEAWNEGLSFKVYQSGGAFATHRDIPMFKQNHVLAIIFVFQRNDLSIGHHLMELV